MAHPDRAILLLAIRICSMGLETKDISPPMAGIRARTSKLQCRIKRHKKNPARVQGGGGGLRLVSGKSQSPTVGDIHVQKLNRSITYLCSSGQFPNV